MKNNVVKMVKAGFCMAAGLTLVLGVLGGWSLNITVLSGSQALQFSEMAGMFAAREIDHLA